MSVVIGGLSEETIGNVLQRAREAGFSGFGGNCFQAAMAINQVLFGGAGRYVGAFNRLFHQHGEFVGHLAVEFDGAYWDADGIPKEFEDIESWGMLDPEDSDRREAAEDLGEEWDDDAAEEVETVRFVDEAEVAMIFGNERVTVMAAILKACLGASVSANPSSIEANLAVDLGDGNLPDSP